MRWWIATGVLAYLVSTPVAAQTCTYTDWAWHSAEGRAVDYKSVRTTREALFRAHAIPTFHVRFVAKTSVPFHCLKVKLSWFAPLLPTRSSMQLTPPWRWGPRSVR